MQRAADAGNCRAQYAPSQLQCKRSRACTHGRMTHLHLRKARSKEDARNANVDFRRLADTSTSAFSHALGCSSPALALTFELEKLTWFLLLLKGFRLHLTAQRSEEKCASNMYERIRNITGKACCCDANYLNFQEGRQWDAT